VLARAPERARVAAVPGAFADIAHEKFHADSRGRLTAVDIAPGFLVAGKKATAAVRSAKRVKSSVSEQESDHVFGPFISFAATA